MRDETTLVNQDKPESLRAMLLRASDCFGDRPAFLQREEGEIRSYSYRSFRSDVEALGTELLCRGLEGKTILVSGDNSYAWAVCYMAVVSGVGVVVPVDRDLSPEGLARVIEVTGASAVLCSDAVAEKVRGLSLGDGTPQILTFFELPERIAAGRIAINHGERGPFEREIDLHAPAAVVFPSGTDVSRGIVLSNANLIRAVDGFDCFVDIDEKDVFLTVLPLHHAYVCTVGLLGALWNGAAVAFGRGLSGMVKDMAAFRPTVMVCVPFLLDTLYRRIRSEIAKRGADKKVRAAIRATSLLKPVGLAQTAKRKLFSDIHRTFGGRMRLLISGGTLADAEVLDGLTELGLLAIQGYGPAECAALMTVNPTSAPKSGSVGMCLPGGILDIYNKQEDGMGEIRYRGENVMSGYCNAPELTEEVKRGEWLYTGDIGYMDEDGYLYVVGQKSNCIVKASGKMVCPEEAEALLCRNDFVNEAVVTGKINDQNKDYDLVAVIHPDYAAFRKAYGDNFTPADVDRELTQALYQVNALLSPYKRLDSFVIRETEFEKTPSRKIKRTVTE